MGRRGASVEAAPEWGFQRCGWDDGAQVEAAQRMIPLPYPQTTEQPEPHADKRADVNGFGKG